MSKQRVWVLLRGLVREKRHWEDFPVTLKAHFPDDEIVLYDFPGNGQRCNEKSVTTIIEMVEDLRLFLSDQPISKPVHIIALSLGAMAAIEWMNKYPDECAAAILIGTSLRGLNPFYQRLLPSTYPAIFKSLISPEDIRQKECRILNLVSNIVANDSAKSDVIVSHWVDYAKQNPVSATNGLRQLIAAMRFRVPAHRPDVTMLVLNSLADHMVNPACSTTLARHWHLAIETHDTAGHDIPLDDAEWVCEKIVKWVQEIERL